MHKSKAIKMGLEYRAITEYYGSRVATRSQVPLMNHINEGLDILTELDATIDAMGAFCLHPLFQNDDTLRDVGSRLDKLRLMSPHSVMLALEYRRAANAYLCTAYTDAWDIGRATREIGPLLPEIRDMLIADKVQNRRDFITYHYGTHPRSRQLLTYFNNWFQILGIDLPDDIKPSKPLDHDGFGQPLFLGDWIYIPRSDAGYHHRYAQLVKLGKTDRILMDVFRFWAHNNRAYRNTRLVPAPNLAMAAKVNVHELPTTIIQAIEQERDK